MRFLNLCSKALVLTWCLFAYSLFASAQVSVSVSSPANGATVGNSFTLYASGSSSNGMSGWYIYVDNNAVWNTPGPASSIAAPLNLSSGWHNVVVRAWDNVGYSGSASLSLNVSQSGSGGVSVSLQSPSDGASVGSSVTVSASASSPNGISGWVVYLDNNNAYQVDNYSSSLTATINVPSGAHSLYVRAWDRVSGYGTSPTISITGGSSGGSIPPNATVFNNIDTTADSTWQACSSCAGGANNTSSYWTANWQTSPSMDGASRQFYVGGPPWTAALFYHKLNSYSGQYDYASHFVWDFWVYVDSNSLNNVWTFEFDLYQAISGWEYMIGTHCSIGDGYWYGWNQRDGYWAKLSSAPCRKSDWAPGVWHHVVWTMERIPGAHNYKYDSLQMDDKLYTLNVTQPAGPIGWSDVLGVQWQVDTNSNGGDVHWWIDKAKLSIW
jgi:hypothetical protein